MARMTTEERHSMLLSCYLDGALTQDELAEVVHILEHDLDAIAEFRRLQEVRRHVRLMPLLDMPRHLFPDGHLSEQLSAYLDGELITAEIPIVTSHLNTCTECRRELADLDRSRIAVRAMPGVEPPEFLAVHREVKRDRRKIVRTAAAVASGAAAVTLVLAIGPFGGQSEPEAITIAELQSRHTAVASVPSTGGAIQVSSTP